METTSCSYSVILLAAGKGERLGAVHNKVLLPLADERPLFDYALRVFLKDQRCGQIVLVIRQTDKKVVEQALKQLYGKVPEKIVCVQGGEERQESVSNGLDTLSEQSEYVMVHDAARPFITQELVDRLFSKVLTTEAAIAAIPAQDTIKYIREEKVIKTLYRPEIWQVQTPQAFKITLLKRAYKHAAAEGYLGNEEGELVERLKEPVAIVKGDPLNFKITTSEDLLLAKGLFLVRNQEKA